MAKRREQVSKFETVHLFAITLRPMVGLTCFLAQTIVVDVGNRMAYEFNLQILLKPTIADPIATPPAVAAICPSSPG